MNLEVGNRTLRLHPLSRQIKPAVLNFSAAYGSLCLLTPWCTRVNLFYARDKMMLVVVNPMCSVGCGEKTKKKKALNSWEGRWCKHGEVESTRICSSCITTETWRLPFWKGVWLHDAMRTRGFTHDTSKRYSLKVLCLKNKSHAKVKQWKLQNTHTYLGLIQFVLSSLLSSSQLEKQISGFLRTDNSSLAC